IVMRSSPQTTSWDHPGLSCNPFQPRAAAAAVALEVPTKHRSLTQRAHRRSPRADSALDAPIQCARQSVVIRRRNRPEYAILLAVRACGEEKRVRAGVPAATQRHSPKAVDRDRFAVLVLECVEKAPVPVVRIDPPIPEVADQ